MKMNMKFKFSLICLKIELNNNSSLISITEAKVTISGWVSTTPGYTTQKMALINRACHGYLSELLSGISKQSFSHFLRKIDFCI
jgi:hypothetical protein